MGIDEVLQENYELKEKIECLNDVINDNLTDLANQIMEERRQRKDEDVAIKDEINEERRIRTEKDISIDARLDKETLERQESDSALQKNVTEVTGQLQEDIDDIMLMPIGSIIAWVMKPGKDAVNISYLPEGWMRCDGTLIPPPSIWAGLMTPELNNKKHFLRGGSDSEYLETEEDQIQKFEISLIDPGHTHNEKTGGHHHSTEDLYYYTPLQCNGDKSKGNDWWYSCDSEAMDWDKDWTTRTVSSTSVQINLDSSETHLSISTSDYRS